MKTKIIIAIAISFLACSCSKKDSPSPDPGGDGGYGVPGAIIFNWATEGILKIDLTTGRRSTVMQENTARYGWDISRDGKNILTATEDPNSTYATLYTYANMSTSAVIAQFEYFEKGELASGITTGLLSPDGTMIAVKPDFDNGIVILNMQGKIIYDLTGFAGEKFGQGTEIAWMPDGSMLFTLKNGVCRTNKDFTKASLLKQVSFSSWGDIAPSPDGSKIALKGGNHIWMMNADGSNLVQVTESSQVECFPVFSPDSKYLLIGTDWRVTGPFGSIWHLAIIPADGRKYNVDKGADNNVIFIQDTQDRGQQASDGMMCWR